MADNTIQPYIPNKEELKEIIKNDERYGFFTILEKPAVFKDFLKNKNFEVVQLHDINVLTIDDKKTIIGFFGVCKWENNKITPLDGDSYDDEMIIYGYSEFSLDENTPAIDIMIADKWSAM